MLEGMVNDLLEWYGKLADSDLSNVEASSRYPIQEGALNQAVVDALAKLRLKGEHSLLDIGCGTGPFLIPGAQIVRHATGVDHEKVLSRIEKNHPGEVENVSLIPGDFLDLDFTQKYDRILIYSVIHHLRDFDQVVLFIDKAVDLLEPQGLLLVGDIANGDLKERFLRSALGKEFLEDWNAEMHRRPASPKPPIPKNAVMGSLSDVEIRELLMRYRTQDHSAWILPQPHDLPFGRTREDLLILKH
jgi:2-polyprenyl-3-methyl-5-hydroxy-6-metoxy-1,4-benzoquinol methylase